MLQRTFKTFHFLNFLRVFGKDPIRSCCTNSLQTVTSAEQRYLVVWYKTTIRPEPKRREPSFGFGSKVFKMNSIGRCELVPICAENHYRPNFPQFHPRP